MTDKLDLVGFHFSPLRCFPSVVVLSRPGPSKEKLSGIFGYFVNVQTGVFGSLNQPEGLQVCIAPQSRRKHILRARQSCA